MTVQERATYNFGLEGIQDIEVYMVMDQSLPLSGRIKLPTECMPDRCKFADQGTLCSLCQLASEIRTMEQEIVRLEGVIEGYARESLMRRGMEP